MMIRPERLDDGAVVGALLERAFGRPDEAAIATALRGSAEYLPELALVAVEDDDIVGHIMFSRALVDGERPGQAALLAPMAVEPSRQGQGIGTALVRAGLARCRDSGVALVVLLGHPTYYPRFGFVPAHDVGVLPPAEWPRDAWMALPLEDDHPRGTVRIAPAFDV